MKKAIANFTWKYDGKSHDGNITEIEEVHGDDFFVRYETETMHGLIEPLIKINMVLKRCYFLTERSSNGEISFPEYETKGLPCKIWWYDEKAFSPYLG